MGELRSLQKAFTEHLRDPEHTPVPVGLDERRMGIYSELIFNNVSALLKDFFPVIKSLLSAQQWQGMVRDFFISHQCQTPYFMALSEEFVQYLSNRQLASGLPRFLPQLAHYEWVELALYTMDENIPDRQLTDDELEGSLELSNLAQPLIYTYPVHRISREYQPETEEVSRLLVCRTLDETVKFFELQPLSFQLLQHIQENPGQNAREWLQQAAEDFGAENKALFLSNGLALLQSFNQHRMFIAG